MLTDSGVICVPMPWYAAPLNTWVVTAVGVSSVPGPLPDETTAIIPIVGLGT